jgi:hypothetical protein
VVEQITITDALLYIHAKTGYSFERRQFTRWVEAGVIEINGEPHSLGSTFVGGRWWLRRDAVEAVILELTKAANDQ